MSIKVQFLNGGLGNQVFQWIFARYYELSHPGETMYLDDSYFAIDTVHNGYELEKVFGLHPSMVSEFYSDEDWKKILNMKRNGKSIPQITMEQGLPTVMIAEADNYPQWNPFNGQVAQIPCNQYFPEILDQDMDGILYYHGYWINGKWFGKYKDIFRKELTFPPIPDTKNKEYMDYILSHKSVSLHIRRGDFVSLGWAFGDSEYLSLNKFYVQNYGDDWSVIVFSDDIEWCKENSEALGINLYQDQLYIEGNMGGNNYIDMQLMASCQGMIVSNSSFCYLAALLNTRAEVVVNSTQREIIR